MTWSGFVALAPVLVVCAAALAAPLMISVRRSHTLAAGTAFVGFAAGAAAIPWALREAPLQVTPLLVVDAYTLFVIGLVFAASAVVVLLAHGFLVRSELERREELYILLLLAGIGAAVLAASDHFASFFLGLETLSVSLYALVAFARKRPASIEAGIKYLILAAATSAVLLLGMAYVYADLGLMGFAELGAALSAGAGGPLTQVGFVLMLVAVGFKLALAPFHMWVADVYQGAPAPVAGFLATVSKAGVVAVTLRLLVEYEGYRDTPIFTALAAMAVLSIVVGNVLALLQPNLKRLLAFSSIAHMGYLLVALLAVGSLAAEAVTFYLVAYVVTTLGAFGVIGASAREGGDEADLVDHLRGLFWTRPALATLMTGSMLSLAGIPLTAGFVAKFTVLVAGVDAALWWLVWTMIAGSAIGVFYYLRVIMAMLREPPAADEAAAAGFGAGGAGVGLPLAAGVGLAALFALLVALGVYPTPVQRLIEGAVLGLL
jgi:NADH-quinone oxidoreductase subunit N